MLFVADADFVQKTQSQDLGAVAEQFDGIAVIERCDTFDDPGSYIHFMDIPDEWVAPRKLLVNQTGNLLYKPYNTDHLDEDLLAQYWEIKQYDIQFRYAIMSYEPYLTRKGRYALQTHMWQTLIFFNFDSSADAVLAKLSTDDLRSISVEDYRRLLGEIGQPSVHLSV